MGFASIPISSISNSPFLHTEVTDLLLNSHVWAKMTAVLASTSLETEAAKEVAAVKEVLAVAAQKEAAAMVVEAAKAAEAKAVEAKAAEAKAAEAKAAEAKAVEAKAAEAKAAKAEAKAAEATAIRVHHVLLPLYIRFPRGLQTLHVSFSSKTVGELISEIQHLLLTDVYWKDLVQGVGAAPNALRCLHFGGKRYRPGETDNEKLLSQIGMHRECIADVYLTINPFSEPPAAEAKAVEAKAAEAKAANEAANEVKEKEEEAKKVAEEEAAEVAELVTELVAKLVAAEEAAQKKAEKEAAKMALALHYFDSSGINRKDMMELDKEAPSAITASVAEFQFYSLRKQGVGTIVSACATKSSRKDTLSIVWIATGDAYQRRGFAKHLVEYIHTKAAEDGFTRIMVLLTHYS
jgi:ribosomal protein S18 acetylase RimI-like enzyme